MSDIVAYPIDYRSNGTYRKDFSGLQLGIVLEDKDSQLILYLTDPSFTEIEGAIILLSGRSRNEMLKRPIYVVCNEDMHKIGIYFNNSFHIVFDVQLRILGRAKIDYKVSGDLQKWTLTNSINDELIKGLM